MPTTSSRVSTTVAIAVMVLGAYAGAQSDEHWSALETVSNGRFSIFSAAGAKEAEVLLQLAEDVHDDFTFLVGLPADTNLFGRGTADMFLLRSHDQYLAWVDTIMPIYRAEPQVLAFYGECPRTLNPVPPVTAAVERGAAARSWVVNATAHLLLTHYLGAAKRPPAWFTEGFASRTEIRFTGSTKFFRVTLGEYGEGLHDSLATKPGRTGIWTDLLEPRVRAGTVRRFDRLKGLSLNRLTFPDLCQSWSLVSYLAEERPFEFARWLALMRRSPRLDRGGWERAFRLAYGWTDAELHERWADWVKLEGSVRRMRAKRRR